MPTTQPPHNPLYDVINLDQVLNNSPVSMIMRSGLGIANQKHLTVGAGNNNSVNIFSFEGPFRLVRLVLIIADNTNIADFTDVGFHLFDGTNSVELTLRDPGGASFNGFNNYSLGIVHGDSGVALGAYNADQVRIDDVLTPENFYSMVVIPKTGVTNYLTLEYDSSSIDVTIVVAMAYEEGAYAVKPTNMTAV